MGGYVYVMKMTTLPPGKQQCSGQTPVEQGRDLFENNWAVFSSAGGPQQRGAKLEGIFCHEVKLWSARPW